VNEGMRRRASESIYLLFMTCAKEKRGREGRVLSIYTHTYIKVMDMDKRQSWKRRQEDG
jgi:hypothetical protein